MKPADGSSVRRLPFLEFAAAGLLVGICCCLPRPAHANTWENVTVVNTMGWEYPNVSVEIVPGESFLILINADGARKKISFSSIRVILDERGKDITGMVLAGKQQTRPAASGNESPPTEQPSPPPYPAPQPQMFAAPAAPPAEMRHSRARFYGPRYRVMLTGDVGYGFPTGDWFQGFTSGFEGGGTIRIAVSDDYYLGFGYMRQWLGVDDELKQMVLYDDYGNPYFVSLDWNVHLDEYMFIFGWMSSPSDLTTPFAYADAGLGAITHVMNVTATLEGQGIPVGTSETKFGMVLTVGGTFPLSKVVGLNLEGDMRLTGSGSTTDYYTDTQSSDGFLFGFRIGLAVLLGGGQ